MSDKELIKHTCKYLGLNQKELANYIGISENTLSQWARGVVKTPAWARKMFDLLIIEKDYKELLNLIDKNRKNLTF